MQPLARLAFSVLAGALTFLSVATFDVWPLMWVALVPLLHALRDRSPGRAFLYGWLCGLCTNLGGFYWINGLLQRFGHMPVVAAVPLWWLLCAYQGLIVAFFSLFLRLVHRRAPGLPYALTVPVLMVACELCVPLIFPWYYAISQAWVVPVIQIADLTGPLGVTFLLMMVNGAVYDLVHGRLSGQGRRWRPAVAAAAVVLVSLGYGQVRLHQVRARRAAAPKVKVGMVQANIGIVEKGRLQLAPRHLQIHQDLSADLQRRGAQLIVWPESSYPYYFERGQAADWRDRKAVRKGFDVPILFGSITVSRRERFPYNTALMMDREGRLTGSFDKVFLLIFGEYVPFYEALESTISRYVPEASNFARGKDPTVFPFEQYRLGPMICYEDIIPQFGRRLARLKPHLFVNITNDAWFGRTSEPYEHMALAVYRTVEHRIEMVRAVNTGVSAYIDATGRVFKKSDSVDPQLTPDAPPVALLDEVAMMQPASVYGAVGDLFGYLCLTVAVYLVLLHGRFRRRSDAESAIA
ncbi:MAG: apolipoprotein N-acyltransferase [Deltaproteobacteria bacterium]|nr:apolipoprotein N-acyltransferase [Deltaproteobacteria bacterium]